MPDAAMSCNDGPAHFILYLSMQKRAVALAVSSAGAGPSTMLATGLVPRPQPQTTLILSPVMCVISLDFLYRGAYRGIDVPGA